ncbi:dirigent protein 21-like [Eucalyptus grandis]|uniref:dirigent protein 21-like n=1 Tax=Eucalyptus grandis TaxID=71139 RepID=UPI00192ED7FA|nr:dirigent protein 21-like [Eucalyptus grandis]
MALTLNKLLLFSCLISSTVLTAKSELLTSKREKLTRFHVYAQDKNTGTNATVVNVAQASTTNQSATSFGLVGVVDDELTVGPEMSSKNLGRLQGMVREMPIVGGTGLFRLARGYVHTSTYSADPKTGVLVLLNYSWDMCQIGNLCSSPVTESFVVYERAFHLFSDYDIG